MTVGTVGQTGSHTGKLDIWLGKAHLLHICQVVEGVITQLLQFEILGSWCNFLIHLDLKSFLSSKCDIKEINTNLDIYLVQTYYLRRVLLIKVARLAGAKVCRKRGQNYLDSLKAVFGPKSTISTCRRRA